MTVTCPQCKQEAQWENNPSRPFCSQRCRTTDLGNWAAGKYRIGTSENEEKDEATAKPKEDEGSGED